MTIRAVLLGVWGLVALVVIAEVGRVSIPDPTVPVTFTYTCPSVGNVTPIHAPFPPVTLVQRDRPLNIHDVLGPCIAQDPGAIDAVMRARAQGGPR